MTETELAEMIVTYNDYLDRVIAAIQHACEDFQESNYQQVSMVIPSVVEGLSWVNEAAENFEKLTRLENGKYDEFREQVKNLGEALENKDYNLLHDLFEFEMIPLLEEMKITDGEIN